VVCCRAEKNDKLSVCSDSCKFVSDRYNFLYYFFDYFAAITAVIMKLLE